MVTIGLHKELDNDERVLVETPNFTYVYGKDSTLLGSDMVAKIYLTNKRFIVLALAAYSEGEVPISDTEKTRLAFQETHAATNVVTKFIENTSNAIGSGLKSIVELSTKGKSNKNINFIWIDLPVSGLNNVKAKGKELTIAYSKLKRGWFDIFRGKPMFTFRIETPDLWRIHLEKFIKEEQGQLKQIKGDSTLMIGELLCAICGTEYKKGTAKIVKCEKCNKDVCREKQEKGLIKSKWVPTNCFNDEEGLCRRCAKLK